ncbi:MAG: hypothetical protein ACRDYB_14495 [Acidimicrobiales bacterium]
MTIFRRSHQVGSGPTVLFQGSPGSGLIAWRPGPWARLAGRLRAASLDAELAAGRVPEASPVRALRAEWLVRPPPRGRLARDWEHLLGEAARSGPTPPSRIPICRNRVISSEAEIRRMTELLRARVPVSASGVARASQLLSEASGPIFDRRSPVDLSDAVGEAIRLLDPTRRLLEPARVGPAAEEA